ncbi:MAG: DM13 domain-containing protein [Actinomycetota bacterium]|nr:DM13 domain-containing protein [Actinomycetota bacterium]
MAFVGLAGCGDESEGQPKGDPFQRIPHARSFKDARANASPRWEKLGVLNGVGDATRQLEVTNGALQWRARWTCRKGALTVRVDPPPATREALIDASCPGKGEGYAVETGTVTLNVQASGPWTMALEQQVDTPLAEPPLAAMSSPGSQVIAEGNFYEIERPSKGRALLYRLADGRLALRFAPLQTSPNTGLFVWVSSATRPRTTAQAFKSRHRQIRALKSTSGQQNYLLPKSIAPDQVRSVVIWCEPIRIAYAAASLKPR